MAGTPNPSLNIRELNGNLSTVADVGEGTVLKIGVGSAYIRNKPIVARQTSTVNRMGVGPLVSSAGPHIENCNRPAYLFQVDAATAGTFGAVTKHPAGTPASPSSLALSAATFDGLSSAPDPMPGGAGAIDRTTGFATPPSPLPLTITAGAGTTSHTATIDYIDEADFAQQTTVAVTAAGTFTTASGVRIKSIVRYRTSIDPVGTQALSWNYSGPLDRFDHLRFQVVRGGQISVSGAQLSQVRYSFDDGVTWSPSATVPSTGILDLYTYPGGFTRWHTGIRATFTQGTVAKTLYGAVRATGATVNGDIVVTFAVAGATFRIVDGAGPAFTNVGSAVTLTTTVATTTGAAIKTFFDTDTSAGTLAAKAYIAHIGTVGTGAGFTAAFAATGAANGGVLWTAKKPGVRIRQLVSGNSTAESITYAGLDVTVNVATDSNGAQTSTPNSLVTLYGSASAAVQALVGLPTVTGTGAGIVGAWDDFVELPISLEEADEWTSYTTPPSFGLTELSAALNTLKNTYLKTLQNIEFVDLVQDDVSNVMYQALVTWLTDVKDGKKVPLWGGVRGLYRVAQIATDDLVWAASFITALPSPRSAGGLVAYFGGEQDTIVSLYGAQMQMNRGTLDLARCMNVVISQSPNQTLCSVLTADGTQFAIPGTGLHTVAEGTEEQQALWESDDALLELHAQNVVTGRTLVEYSGVFIRQTLCYVDDGSDFIFWERRRVMNRAFRRVNRSLLVMLNANVLTDPARRTLAEVQAQQIERRVRGDLNNGGLVNDNGVNHVSAFEFTVSRIEQTARTLTIAWSLTMVPLAKVLKLDGTIGYAITLSDTFTVGTD